jgi:hypothetical protein
MSSLSEIYIKKETLETLLKTVNAKGEKGVSLTISIGDETNQYGQNLSGFVSQTKEQREAQTTKYYVGNGKVFWTNGTITKAEAKQKEQSSQEPIQNNAPDELPF